HEDPCPVKPQCFQANSPVCGSDGHTYKNSCAMYKQSCGFVKVISKGPCKDSPQL
ncbi:unnamed protein product, partial [Candidula unifasciata]